MSKKNNSSIFNFFSSESTQNEKKTLELNARISLLTQKLNHEQIKRDQTYQELKEAKKNLKKKPGQKTPLSFTRAVKRLQTQDSLISVFESSLLALEEMNANLLAQQISSDTTQLLRKTTRSMRGLNVEEMDDDLAAADEFREQREELAAMMAQNSQEETLEDYMAGLQFSSDEDDADVGIPETNGSNQDNFSEIDSALTQLPAVPSNTVSMKKPIANKLTAEF